MYIHIYFTLAVLAHLFALSNPDVDACSFVLISGILYRAEQMN